LYAEPSRQLVRDKEAVIRAQLGIEKNRLKQEARDRDQADAQRRDQALQAQRRRRWRDALMQRVFENVPPESLAATSASVDELLETVWPESGGGPRGRELPPNITAKVDALIEIGSRPVRRRQEQNRAIEEALKLGLRQSVRQDALLKMAARSEVEKAVHDLPDHAGCTEMRAAADAAVVKVNAVALHEEKIEREGEIPLFGLPLGATSAEIEEARGLLHNALRNRHELPVGASDSQFRKVRDDALAPVVERINRREEAQERQQRDARRRSAIDHTVSFVSLILPGATLEEVTQAQPKLRLALEKLPSNAGDREWEAAKESVLGPIKTAIQQRSDARFDKMFRASAHKPRVSRGRERPS
jgi:hypothetical protein